MCDSFYYTRTAGKKEIYGKLWSFKWPGPGRYSMAISKKLQTLLRTIYNFSAVCHFFNIFDLNCTMNDEFCKIWDNSGSREDKVRRHIATRTIYKFSAVWHFPTLFRFISYVAFSTNFAKIRGRGLWGHWKIKLLRKNCSFFGWGGGARKIYSFCAVKHFDFQSLIFNSILIPMRLTQSLWIIAWYI